MSDSKPFHILRLPTEIRLMVYREVWTLPSALGSNSDTAFKSDSGSGSEEDIALANLQLITITTIQNLSITCQKIRSELVDTYFTRILPTTQFHLPTVYAPHHLRFLHRSRGPTHARCPPALSHLALTNYKVLEVLRSSSLFTDYIQHISIHWSDCYCSQSSKYQLQMSIRPDGLNWLAEMERLKTVELVFTKIPRTSIFCNVCRLKLLALPRTVEKFTFWTFVDDFADDSVFASAQEREAQLTKWWWTKRPLALAYKAAREETEENGEKHGHEEGTVREKSVRKHLKAIKERRLLPERKDWLDQKLEHHIGAVGVEWPLVDEV